MDQLDADPLVGQGPRDPIPESDMAGPSATRATARCRHTRIPHMPLCTTTTASAVTNVPDDDHDEFESEIDDDAEGEDAHAISTSSNSDD